jgi:hypothetical protein
VPVKTKELRTPILLVLSLVAAAALSAYLNEQNNDDWGSPSSYSARRFGAKAAYLLLLQSGYKVERWTRFPQELPREAGGITLVLAGPENAPDEEQAEALARFVRAGGRAIVTGQWISSTHLTNSLSNGPVRVGFAECKPSAPTVLTRAGTITQEGETYWDTPATGQVVHYRDAQGHAVVVSYPLGQGEVIWWASPLPLTNIGIRDKGNLDLLLYAVGRDRRILWDEYFHTNHDAKHVSHYAKVLRWGECQVLLLGAVLLLAYGRRSGPLVRLARVSRLSPMEFVQTMGSVFHKADARLAPLEIAFARLQSVASGRLSLQTNASAEAIALAMQKRGYDMSEQLSQALCAAQDAMSNPSLKEKLAVEHTRTIHRVLAELERERKRNG